MVKAACRTAVLCGLLALAVANGAVADHAAALSADSAVTRELAARTTSAHTLSASPGDYVRGNLSGIAMRLVLLDATGKRVRVLARGRAEEQPFMFVAGTDGPYQLEVRAPDAGAFTLRIEKIIPPAAQRAPAAVIDSPRLRELVETLAQGGNSTAFWKEMERAGTPMIEYDAELPSHEAQTALVTFLWRGAARNVRLFGGPSHDHDELHRLGDSDVWYRSYRLPLSTRLAYQLAPDVPELDASPQERRRAILATAQRDPFNPRIFPANALDAFDADSILELPQAPPQQWAEPIDSAPAGEVVRHRLTSRHLGNTRDIHLYRPRGYRPGADGNALLVVFDADRYLQEIPTPLILDNLIAAGAIPPTAAVLIGNPSPATRSAELPPNDKFVEFLATELLPWVREQGVQAPAARTVIAGSSYGGLAAAYAGLKHPELFGNVYSQSGSFWWAPQAGSDTEPEWLTRQYALRDRQPLRLYLEAGQFETGFGQDGIFETTRHLRDVLRAKGYEVTHREYAAGHDDLHWRGTLATGLVALLGSQRAVPATGGD